jgi:hypothetical protein
VKAASRFAQLLRAPLVAAAFLALAAAGVATAAAPGVATASAAGVATASMPASAPNVANIPAAAQPLVAKIANAKVTSERFSIAMVGPAASRRGAHGKPAAGTLAHVAVGEASLVPLRAKLYRRGSSGPLAEVALGSTIYINDASLSGHKARPWVKAPGESAAGLFPFHGGSNYEIDAGGRGPYAELLNLLATASDLQVLGPASVAGQQTIELSATVQPLALVQGTVPGDLGEASARMEVFVSEAGVPVRVVRRYGSAKNAAVETIDVLALNVHVSVKAPPKRRTVGRHAVEQRVEDSGVIHQKSKQ